MFRIQACHHVVRESTKPVRPVRLLQVPRLPLQPLRLALKEGRGDRRPVAHLYGVTLPTTLPSGRRATAQRDRHCDQRLALRPAAPPNLEVRDEATNVKQL